MGHQVIKVAINLSEYRLNDFNHPNKEVFNHRYQIDLYVRNPCFDSRDTYSPEYLVSVGYITVYSEKDEISKQDAYNFYIKALTNLVKYSEADTTKGREDRYYHTDYAECGLEHKGFPSFISEYMPIETVNIGIAAPKLLKAKYIFYSSLKLLSYPMDGGNVEIAFSNKGDLIDFLSNPPPLVDLLCHNDY